jgi:UDP-2,4-diacetamido-2,4,6-trideoxy-beta-L-altropyranose hydrolase
MVRMDRAAVTVRPAVPDDRDRILEWANDPVARAAGFHPQPIAPDEHARWFAGRLAHPATGRIWIGRLDGEPIGIIRVEREADGSLIVSIALALVARGRRLSAPLLDAGLAVAREAFPGARFRAWIKADNGPSLALFRGAHFVAPTRRSSEIPAGAATDVVVLERD